MSRAATLRTNISLRAEKFCERGRYSSLQARDFLLDIKM
jgi:hypothetical protein